MKEARNKSKLLFKKMVGCKKKTRDERELIRGLTA